MINSEGVLITEIHKPKNRIEFYETVERMYKRRFKNVNIVMNHEGLEVEYDLIEAEPSNPKLIELLASVCTCSKISDLNKKHKSCFIPYPDF